jgi:hypothetical protein
MMPLLNSNVYEIVQSPGVVAIIYEMVHDVRVIPLDGRPHVGDGIRAYLGDSRGRFDGDSLVVETRNFTDRTPYRGSSDQLRLIERFTPASANSLQWTVTLDDPQTWARPWTIEMPLTRSLSGPLEYACHEGNYALRHIVGIPAESRTAGGTARE